nr:hypothetical protein [uncultured Duganella sp.]
MSDLTPTLLFPMSLAPLRGERLVLRAMEDADALALLDLYGDPR